MQAPERTNRLAKEKSPYLLQHAGNPVDWFPWGEEAFEKARRENKPIFLSVGYSTCHWCHVMERESFENDSVAEILNRNFVSVKVDREERPDVDRVYMTFIQAATGSGGWPMSVWLTPDLKPFTGGTYFPPDDRYGRPGFVSVLNRIAELWSNEAARLLDYGERALQALRESSRKTAAGGAIPALAAADHLFAQLAGSFDPEEGGFGHSPKFPRPVVLEFLLAYHARTHRAEALQMAGFTLQKMVRGGMNDQLGGGFHRYSVDREWHVPHFEKMLYDQGQIVNALLRAHAETGTPEFARAVHETLNYVLRDLRAPGGAFFSAEDADSAPTAGAHEKVEGAFYVWTRDEIAALLPPAATTLVSDLFGVEPAGNVQPASDPHGELTGKNVLIQRVELAAAARSAGIPEEEAADRLESARKILLAERVKRPRPHLDDKVITAWNGLMISAFARAGILLSEPRYVECAREAATFFTQDIVVRRSFRGGEPSVEGFADDYAFQIQGLLDLYEATGEVRWLQRASMLQAQMDELFLDAEAGGYFSVTGRDPSILLRMKEDHDGAEPSANSVACLNLLRLSSMTGAKGLRERAEGVLMAFAPVIENVPAGLPLMVTALEAFHAAPVEVVIAGTSSDPTARELARVVLAANLPGVTLLWADGGDGQHWISQQLPHLAGVQPIDGKPAAYVCRDFACQPPVTDADALRDALVSRAAS